MGLGQTMLTSMFLVLLSLAAISANRLILDRESSYYEEEAYKQSAILANALLQEIVRKKYDSGIDTSSWGYTSTTSFLLSTDLGPSWAAAAYVNPGGAPDTFPYRSINDSSANLNFDDIDDYKGYKRSANAGPLTGFLLSVDVYYVRLSGSTYVKTSTRQYFKQIDVFVKNPKYLKDSLRYSTIASY